MRRWAPAHLKAWRPHIPYRRERCDTPQLARGEALWTGEPWASAPDCPGLAARSPEPSRSMMAREPYWKRGFQTKVPFARDDAGGNKEPP